MYSSVSLVNPGGNAGRRGIVFDPMARKTRVVEWRKALFIDQLKLYTRADTLREVRDAKMTATGQTYTGVHEGACGR